MAGVDVYAVLRLFCASLAARVQNHPLSTRKPPAAIYCPSASSHQAMQALQDCANAQERLFTKEEIQSFRAGHLRFFTEDEQTILHMFWAKFMSKLVVEIGWQRVDNIVSAFPLATFYMKRFFLKRQYDEFCPFMISCMAFKLANCSLSLPTIHFYDLYSLCPAVVKSFSADRTLVLKTDYDIYLDVKRCASAFTEVLAAFEGYRCIMPFKDSYTNFPEFIHNNPEVNRWKLYNYTGLCATISLSTDASLLFPAEIAAMASFGCAGRILNIADKVGAFLLQKTSNINMVTDCMAMLESTNEKNPLLTRQTVDQLLSKLPKIKNFHKF